MCEARVGRGGADSSDSAGLPKHVRGFVEAGIFTHP